MRWNSTLPGELRSVRKFAWLPTECHNGVTVWLELYTSVERYEIGFEREGWFLVERIAE